MHTFAEKQEVMSRSYIKNKYIKCAIREDRHPNRKEKHRNITTGKLLESICPGAWGYRETGSRQGHQRHSDRRHIPSGLVRARLKREANKEIEFSLTIGGL